ncbi:MAG: DUF4381 domain-containing protein [Candidatus Oxydemutatoraceae bacterium WSBS_2016_MAG_OTU14]
MWYTLLQAQAPGQTPQMPGQTPQAPGQAAQDLLEQLRDLALPEAPSWWPPAPGWWLLIALAVLIGIIGYVLQRYWRQRTLASPTAVIHQSARIELQRTREIFYENNNHAQLMANLSTLLRRTAMSLGDRNKVAGLTGDAWIAWLEQCAGTDFFSDEQGKMIVSAQYQSHPQFDGKIMLQKCSSWLEHACNEGKTAQDDV